MGLCVFSQWMHFVYPKPSLKNVSHPLPCLKIKRIHKKFSANVKYHSPQPKSAAAMQQLTLFSGIAPSLASQLPLFSPSFVSGLLPSYTRLTGLLYTFEVLTPDLKRVQEEFSQGSQASGEERLASFQEDTQMQRTHHCFIRTSAPADSVPHLTHQTTHL